MCSVETIGTVFDVALKVLYVASAWANSSVTNHSTAHYYDADDLLIRNGVGDPEHTLGDGTMKIVDDFFVWDKQGTWKTVMETIRGQGADGVVVTEDALSRSSQTYVAPAPKWCQTETYGTGVENGPITMCYIEIVYDEERIADEAGDIVDIINQRVSNNPTEAQYKIQRERMVAEMDALLTAHELCHHQFPEYDDDDDPYYTDPTTWNSSVNACARQVYKDVYGTEPVTYKVANQIPVSAAIELPTKIDSVVSQYPLNFAATIEAHDVWPTLPSGSTKERVSVLP